MAKRIILISSGPILVALVVTALVITGIGRGQLPKTPEDLEQAKAQIISLLGQGAFAAANETTDKLIADFPATPQKGQALQQIAGAYQNAQQYDRAITLCDYVLNNWPQDGFAVWAGMSKALSQTAKGDLSAAQITANELIADYANDANLPWVLSIIADDSSWRKIYDRAKEVYGVVAEKFPDTPWGAKAALGMAGAEVLSLIEEQSYSLAEQELDLMVADFNDNPDLPQMLSRIAEQFGWHRRYSEANDVFTRLVRDYPQSAAAGQAPLWAARMNASNLIKSGKDNEALAAIDKLITDFNTNPGLPEAVYWIGKEYEWTKGTVEDRTTRYDTPTGLYQRLTQQFAGSSRAADAEWDYKRITHRTKIFTLMPSAEQNQIDTAIAEMAAAFAGRPELASELYWVAREYEEYPAKYPLSKQMYQQIMAEFPSTIEANQAALDIPRLEILQFIQAGDINAAETAIDKFVADFNGYPHATFCLRRIATEYYTTGMNLKAQQERNAAIQYFTRAKDIWQRIIDRFPPMAGETDTAYFFSASSFREMGEYEKAINYFQIVLDDWPDYEYACTAQAAIGWCYAGMAHSGLIPKDQADALIEQAYTALLTKYPDCPSAGYAAITLADMKLRQGDTTAAAQYYKLFLRIASPDDLRLKAAQAAIAQIEGGDK